jgi:hypothetical protein
MSVRQYQYNCHPNETLLREMPPTWRFVPEVEAAVLEVAAGIEAVVGGEEKVVGGEETVAGNEEIVVGSEETVVGGEEAVGDDMREARSLLVLSAEGASMGEVRVEAKIVGLGNSELEIGRWVDWDEFAVKTKTVKTEDCEDWVEFVATILEPDLSRYFSPSTSKFEMVLT